MKLTNPPRSWLLLLIASCCLNSWPLSGQEVSREQFEEIRKDAEQGFAKAQHNLGLCYANGQGVVKNGVEAVKWYRKAAEQGGADAQFQVGAYYDLGSGGVVKNEVEAYKWYLLSASQGIEIAKQAVTESEKFLSNDLRAEGQRKATEWQAEFEASKKR